MNDLSQPFRRFDEQNTCTLYYRDTLRSHLILRIFGTIELVHIDGQFGMYCYMKKWNKSSVNLDLFIFSNSHVLKSNFAALITLTCKSNF